MRKLTNNVWQAGFTLLELMVAMSIFAVMSLMIFGGLKEVLDVRSATDLHTKRLTELQIAFMHIGRDMRQFNNRGIRDQFGSNLESLKGNEIGQYKIELTRDGYSNYAKVNRSSLQRVAYGIDDNKLYRYHWLVLDRAADSEPVKMLLLDNIEGFKLRYLDTGASTTTGISRDWVTYWPPISGTVIPDVIEVTLELDDWGRFTRVFDLPDAI